MNILKGLADKVKHTATKVFEASKSRIKSLKPHMEKLKPCVEKIKPYVAKIKSQLNKLKPYIEKAKSYFKTDAGKKVLVGLAVISTIAIVIVVASIAGSSENDNSNIEVAATVATTEASTGETTKIVKADTAIAETTTEEMATEEETTIEVIAVENLNISNEDLSGRKEVHRNQNQAQAQDPEPNVSGQSPLVSNTSTPLSSGNEISGLVYGIDISKWQGDIDWAKVKAAGYEFVMIKCGGRSIASHAQLYVDNRFKENIEGAIASGMQVGVYFFSQAVNEREAQEEASLVIELLKNYQITYPVAFDWETAWGYRTYNANISKTTFTNMVNVFCSMIAQAGYEPMVYGNYDDLNRFDVVSVASKYKIWYARWYYKYENTSALYVAGEATPNLNFPYQMWQYKSTGKVPGIYGDVDLNVAFFSYSADSKYEITVKNKNISSNILRSKFYVCPICNNIIRTVGDAVISCCGITLPPIIAEETDDNHQITIEKVEDEHFITVSHDMTKEHFISFICFLTTDRVEFIKLYPEGNAETRINLRGGGYLYFYCNKHGLFKKKI